MDILKRMAIAAAIGVCAAPGLAYDVVVDRFDQAVNTIVLNSFGVPVMAVDTGLATVLGGSRALSVDGAVAVQAGVIPAGVLDYMSIFTGLATVTYDGDGEGLGNVLANCEAIEVEYLVADDSAQGIGTGPTQITLGLTGGGAASASLPITAAAGTLSFPLSAFAAVDLENLAELAMTIDGTASDSADLAVDAISAVGCQAPPSPSPAMGPFGLLWGSLVLAGLGLFGVARRRRA